MKQREIFGQHEPYANLRDVMARLPMHRASHIGELLPHRWLPLARSEDGDLRVSCQRYLNRYLGITQTYATVPNNSTATARR